MPVPIVYRGAGNVTATYDWLDLTSGVGYRTYYATQSALTGGVTTKFLSVNAVQGKPYYVTRGTAGAGVQTLYDDTYDITMGVPAIISGQAILGFTFSITVADSAETYGLITVSHVRGGVVTQIGQAQSKSRTLKDKIYRECVVMTLTEKKFAVDDILRMNIKLKSNDGNHATITYEFWFDPASRLTQNDSDKAAPSRTDIPFHVPFKIDVS